MDALLLSVLLLLVESKDPAGDKDILDSAVGSPGWTRPSRGSMIVGKEEEASLKDIIICTM